MKNAGGRFWKINGTLETMHRGQNSSRSFNSVFQRHNKPFSEIIWESCSLPCVQTVYMYSQSAVSLPADSSCSELAINPAKGRDGTYSCVTFVQCPGGSHWWMMCVYAKRQKKPTLLANPTSHIQKEKEYNVMNNRIIFHSLCSLEPWHVCDTHYHWEPGLVVTLM